MAGFRFKLLPIQLNIFFLICFVMYNFSKITINFMNLSAEWQHWLDKKFSFLKYFLILFLFTQMFNGLDVCPL